MQNGTKKIHGYVVTDTADNIIELYVSKTRKSVDVMRTIIDELFKEDIIFDTSEEWR